MRIEDLKGQLMHNVPLAEYTSWRVGGPASKLFIPADSKDAAFFVKTCPPDMPILWLGLGSNMLIRDHGFEGAVVITQGALSQITLVDETLVRVEAGVSCAQIARYTARLGLTGLEFMAGIPGTVGGALAMNAGCYGGETWDCVFQVEMVDRSGEIRVLPRTDFTVGYRHVQKPQEAWFIAGYFRLQKGDKNQSLEKIRIMLEKRNQSQPTNLPNCGSVFRNPPNDYAARLIEQAGLKGMAIGGARVSSKHANFIINEGHAKAEDIENLIQHVFDEVFKKHGVQLIREVCIIGRAASKG